MKWLFSRHAAGGFHVPAAISASGPATSVGTIAASALRLFSASRRWKPSACTSSACWRNEPKGQYPGLLAQRRSAS